MKEEQARVKLGQSGNSLNLGPISVTRRLNTVGQIRDELRRLILKGAFEPGTYLSQVRLTEQLGVGRTPLREALRMLQQEGLIQAEHNKRPRLRSFDPEVIDANFAEIILLASLAAAVSVPRLTDEDINPIRDWLKQMRLASQRRDLDGWKQADEKFHTGMFVYISAPLARSLKRAYDQNKYYLRFVISRENMPWENKQHEMILDACASRNGDLAAKLLARHVAIAGISLFAEAMPESEPGRIRAAMRLLVQKPELVVPKGSAMS